MDLQTVTSDFTGPIPQVEAGAQLDRNKVLERYNTHLAPEKCLPNFLSSRPTFDCFKYAPPQNIYPLQFQVDDLKKKVFTTAQPL